MLQVDAWCHENAGRVQVPVMCVDTETGDITPQKKDGVDMMQPLQVWRRPLCLTAGMYKGMLVVDLDADEDEILGSSISVIVDDTGAILGTVLHTSTLGCLPRYSCLTALSSCGVTRLVWQPFDRVLSLAHSSNLCLNYPPEISLAAGVHAVSGDPLPADVVLKVAQLARRRRAAFRLPPLPVS